MGRKVRVAEVPTSLMETEHRSFFRVKGVKTVSPLASFAGDSATYFLRYAPAYFQRDERAEYAVVVQE